MKCQVCHTKEPKVFASSVLICERCLLKKQASQYTLDAIKQANQYLKEKISEAMLYGTDPLGEPPKGILGTPKIVVPPVMCTRCGLPTSHESKLCMKCRVEDSLMSGLTIHAADSASDPLTVDKLMQLMEDLKPKPLPKKDTFKKTFFMGPDAGIDLGTFTHIKWTHIQDYKLPPHAIGKIPPIPFDDSYLDNLTPEKLYEEVFDLLMKQPIKITPHLKNVLKYRTLNIHFGDTMPLLDNVILPLPI